MNNEELETCLKLTRNHLVATSLAMKARHSALLGLVAARFSAHDQTPMDRAVIADTLEHLAKAELERLLIGLEDKQPGIAAAAQAILDADGRSTGQA